MAGLRKRQGGQVLIMIFLGSLFLGASAAGLGLMRGGTSIHDLRKEAKGVVPDEDRRKRIDAVLDQWEDHARSFDHSRAKLGKELSTLLDRHDATRADFDEVIRKADSINSASRQTLLDLRDDLRSNVTAEEWRALFRPPASGLAR